MQKKKLAVSPRRLQETAWRLLRQKLVSPEILYLEKILGHQAEETRIEAEVRKIRQTSWAEIMKELEDD